MQVEFTGRQTDVPASVRALVERKLRKLSRVLHAINHVHVILSADKHRQIAEVTVQSPHLTLAAQEESGDLFASLSTVMDKLTRQAERHVGKRRERRRRAPARATALWAGVVAPAPGGNGAPRVVRSRRFVVRPMTVEEAMAEVETNEEGFLVYRDAATERMNVLYRRKDGNLGLIEPEA
jgi:putative sigma-54 modulation protein